MRNARISIITINYNNLKGLKDTAESIINQTCKDFEWVIIDGGSTDGSKEYIESISKYADYWVSEPDKGIYNAMNKGTQKATGEYCWYMNSGDCIYNDTVIEQLIRLNLHEDVVGFINCHELDGKIIRYRYPKKSINLSDFVGLNPEDNNRIGSSSLSHQATLIKRHSVLNTPYDESMKIAADYKLWIELLIMKNGTYKSYPIKVCRFNICGVSSSNSSKMEATLFLENLLPPRIVSDYIRLAKLRRTLIWKIMTKFFSFLRQ